MPMTNHDDGVDGPARSQVWDAALCLLVKHSRVELDAVMAELDDVDATAAEVRETLDGALVRHGWLKRPERREDV